jgi:tetrahydromethanopterin S-methyltransferase subunit D
MKRQSLNLGCVIAGLGLVLLCCLLPYAVSSVYSIVGSVLSVSGGPTWLWGEWVNQLAGGSDFLYMVLTEGPVCAVGTIALLFVILGLVLVIGGGGRPQADYVAQDYVEEAEELAEEYYVAQDYDEEAEEPAEEY